MEAKEKRILKNSVGMFDLVKGFAMIIVVLAHTISQYDYTQLPIWILIPYGIIGYGLLPMFFIISGYGFRTQNILKCIRQQASFFLRPYILVTFGIAIIFPCVHTFFFRWPKGAFIEMLREVLAFILGISSSASNIKIGTLELYDCGTMWFLLTLMNSWIILNIITNLKNKVLEKVIVIVTVLLGFFLCHFGIWVYCIQASLIAVGYLYVGYMIKKQKLLWKNIPVWSYVILVAGCMGGALFGEIRMYDNYWKLGLLDIFFSICSGFLWIKVALYCNHFEGIISRVLRVIGRHSLWVMCIHTIESLCIPWYLFANLFAAYPIIGIGLQLVLHCVIIFAGCLLIDRYILLKRKLKIIKRNGSI